MRCVKYHLIVFKYLIDSYVIGVYGPGLNVAGLGWRACFFAAGLPGVAIGAAIFITVDVRSARKLAYKVCAL